MRALVLGCGSIGRRHALNLKALGVQVLVRDPDPERVDTLAEEPGIDAADEDDADFDIVVVATPTSHHVEDLAWGLERQAHVFVEKPLGASHADVRRALELRSSFPDRCVMVGCNLRFTEGFTLLQAHLSDTGRPVALLADFGWWLPAWRPAQDYRTSYSARRALGGGVVLDAIHEIDYTLVLGGPAADVSAACGTTGILELDVEDIADLTIRHTSGLHSHIHLDYLRRTYSRSCTVIGDLAMLTWDVSAGRVVRVDEPGSQPQTIAADLDGDRNRQYLEEMRHFLNAVDRGEQSWNGIEEAAATTEVALTALDRGMR